ncbi:protein kinase [Cytobacillus sp. FJAT-53684]|uniref:non-specific serine/threonine protein kinase n=1 Tax=Cytobacillus mangrovibacter TaxID=3299024 RepID=A0ABW6JUV5_9BACI
MADYDHLCFGCMEDKGSEPVCPHCGWEVNSPIESPQHLPPGTILQEKYLLGRVLGHGGFGITYLAYDVNLDTKLAIKEYMPRDFATRAPEQTMVSVFSGELTTHFENGLINFLDEAKTLAQFNNHPGIVGVRDFFRENETAYLVMYYLKGIDFKQYLESQGGKIPFQTTLMIMIPVMDALREVHRTGTLHRDISPDNIYITAEGQVKILDFGAARYAMTAFSKSISVILKPGFAPEEQYRSKGKQGPWTDVYSTAATFYRAIVGHVPPESLDRLEEDTIKSPSSLGIDIPEKAEAALMKALSVKATDRYQSIADFQQDLFDDQNLSDQPISNVMNHERKKEIQKKDQATPQKKKTVSKWVWIGGGATIVLLLIFGIVGSLFLFKSLTENKSEKPVENTTRVETEQNSEEKEEIAEETIKQLTVPNLVNHYEDHAKTLLQNEGLKLGEITYVESLYVKKGIVTTQSMAADQQATENDVINLEVSKGIELPLDEEAIKSQHLKLVYEYWDKGYELNKQKDYFNALKYYLQARDMAEIIYKADGNFDAQYSMGVLDRNITLAKRSLGYFEFALIDIESSVDILEDLLTKDPLFQKDHVELANSYADLSFIQFLNQMPEEAVTSAEKAIELNPNTLIYKVNLAHAYLFSDQFDAAVDVYTKNIDEKVNEQQSFKEFVLGDFNYFRKFNITHPDMEKIETIYANTDEVYSDEEEIQKTIYDNGIAIEQEDVAGYMSTIDPKSGSYPVTEKAIKDLFYAYNNFKLVIESIEILEVNANTARAKVSQVLTYSDGSQSYQAKSIMIHNLVQGEGTYKWLISTTETEGS